MTHNPFDLEGIAAVEAKQADSDRVVRDQERDDLSWLMSSAKGRRIVWRLLEQAGVFRSSFSTNALAMAYAEGHRNTGLRTLDLIHRVCPQLYQVMVKENADDGADVRKHPK